MSWPPPDGCWMCGGRTAPESEWVGGDYRCDCDEGWVVPDRRKISRDFCGKGGCTIPAGHPGPHRGDCGCIVGCGAEGCPNLTTLKE